MSGLSFFSVTDFNVGRSFSSLLRLFRCSVGLLLALSVRIPDEEKMLTQIFIFKLLCGAPEGFTKALKGFIEPFEASQRSMKIKFQLIGCSMLVGRRPMTSLSSVCLPARLFVRRSVTKFSENWIIIFSDIIHDDS